MPIDAAHALDAVLGIAARLARQTPFEGGVAELCGRIAVLGGARGLALLALQGDAEVVPLGTYGLPLDYLRRFPPGRPVPLKHATGDVREAIQRGEPVSVCGIGDDPRTVSLNAVAQQGGFDAVLAVPLIFDGRPVGVTHAFFSGQPRPEREDLLMRLGPLLGGTLAREQLRLAASTPGISGSVHARAELDRHARRVHAAAERYGQPYTVAVYALDHPAILGRRYGEALTTDGARQLGQAVETECRDADVSGSVDDHCFAVVMAGTEQHGAFHQCERVLARFGRHVFKVGEQRLQLSASAAISCFPENGALNADASVRSARGALLHALGHDGTRVVAIAARGSAAPD